MRFLQISVLAVAALVSFAGRTRADTERLAPWLGIAMSQGQRGVYIQEVVPDTPADIAGLQVGDEIVRVGGVLVHTSEELVEQVRAHAVGDTVAVQVRSRLRRTLRVVNVTLSGLLDQQELFYRRLVHRKAPELILPTSTFTDRVILSKQRGKVVILQFFDPSAASSAALLRRLHAAEVAAHGALLVLGVSLSSRASTMEFIEKNSVLTTVLVDSGAISRGQYPFYRGPAVVVIGKDGRVVHADCGESLDLGRVLFTAKQAGLEPAPYSAQIR